MKVKGVQIRQSKIHLMPSSCGWMRKFDSGEMAASMAQIKFGSNGEVIAHELHLLLLEPHFLA